MRLWRLSQFDSLNGLGGLTAGARWHLPGQPVVYCAESAALAALEVLANTRAKQAPANLLLLEIEAPRLRVDTVATSELPPDWRKYPAPKPLAELGTQWLLERRSALLRVPSAIVPQEHNVLLNPLHRSADRVKVVSAEIFQLDPRLFEEES